VPHDHILLTGFESAWPVRDWCDLNVVLAVSGGPDSVALLRASLALKEKAIGRGQLIVAHLNHGLRGCEAEADEMWIRSLCQRFNVRLETAKLGEITTSADAGDGWEAAAREARYEFLRTTAERLGARYVATGHTFDDQVETVLHRIVRGTGLAGLTGIPTARPLSPGVSVIRPLLKVRHRDVLSYLAAISQDYRTDSSNAERQWTRNWLRHELLPLVRERCNGDVDAALFRLAKQAGEAQQLIAEMASQIAQGCVHVEYPKRPESGGSADCGTSETVTAMRIECRQLRDKPSILVREVCKVAWQQANWPQQAMGFDQWQQLADFALAGQATPPLTLPGNVRASREEHLLHLRATD
jgi:tRNA(Ile)-lysidine synthase